MSPLPGWLKLGRTPAAPHLELGRRGERDAARFLKKAGCRILARNLQTPGGEADLVCLDRDAGAIVLAEVKARVQEPGQGAIPPTTAINADKRRRLAATARSLASLPRFSGRPVRIDILTVEYRHDRDRAPAITHYPNAVTADARLR